MAKKNKLTNLEKEVLKIQWKDIYINGKLTNYQISNSGLVMNKNTKKLVCHGMNEKGYLQIKIPIDGKTYTRKIHQLVALAFIPNPENKPEVNHKDGNKENCHDWNLEWTTRNENVQHAYDTGLIIAKKGSDSPSAKYTDKQVHEICKLLEQGKGNVEVSEITGINESVIINIKGGRQWTDISSQYKIPDTKKYNTYTEEIIRNVCKSLEEKIKGAEIAKTYNVTESLVKDIKAHRSWKHVSKDYNF